jgi:hypothetical protein
LKESEEQAMKKISILYPVLGILSLFGVNNHMKGQSECNDTPSFQVFFNFTIRADNCDEDRCVLNAGQEATMAEQKVIHFKECDKKAGNICAAKPCPEPEKCQAITEATYAGVSFCTVDDKGEYWCTYGSGKQYGCVCVGNKVTVAPSNTNGNYCPGDHLTLSAETTYPIHNISYIQWFKNDTILLAGADAQTYAVNSTGS